MDLPLQIEKITGLPREGEACGIFSKRITFTDGTGGTIVSCILARGGKSEDIQTNLSDIFELLTRKVEDATEGVLQSLKIAKEACNDYISRYELSVSLVNLIFYKEACFVAREGDGVKIEVFDGQKSLEITFEEGSGPVKEGQIYLIATSAFLSIFERSLLLENGKIDLREVIDGFATEISSKENQSEIGAVFILVKREETTVTEEIKEPEESGVLSETEEKKFEPSDDTTGEDFPLKEKGDAFSRRKINIGGFLVGLLRGVGMELKKLKKGDIRAILRLRRNIAVLVILIILILGFSVFFAVGQRNKSARLADFNTHFSGASGKYSEAIAIIQLNKSRAREILIEADKEVKDALSIDPKNNDAKKLSQDISGKLKETEGSTSVNFKVLSEVSSPLVSLSSLGKNLVGISDGKIFEVNTSDKSTLEFKGPSGAKVGFGFSDFVYVLTDTGVFRVDLAKKETKEIIKKEKASDLAVFFGNIYLLSGDSILKSTPIENGYTDASNYLNEKINFGEDSRFAIDGSVWVTSGNKIYKFMRGSKQDFEISGLLETFNNFGIIYTDSASDNLYVLDKNNSAVLVIDKKGMYQKVYQSEEFGNMSGLVVDEVQGKMYISTGSKILESDL